MRPVVPGSNPDIGCAVGFQPVGMRCVESLSVPFSGVTSLIVPGLDPVPGADLELR
jgi:hypothetical protein